MVNGLFSFFKGFGEIFLTTVKTTHTAQQSLSNVGDSVPHPPSCDPRPTPGKANGVVTATTAVAAWNTAKKKHSKSHPLFFFTHIYFPPSGQAVVSHRCRPFFPLVLAFNFYRAFFYRAYVEFSNPTARRFFIEPCIPPADDTHSHPKYFYFILVLLVHPI